MPAQSGPPIISNTNMNKLQTIQKRGCWPAGRISWGGAFSGDEEGSASARKVLCLRQSSIFQYIPMQAFTLVCMPGNALPVTSCHWSGQKISERDATGRDVHGRMNKQGSSRAPDLAWRDIFWVNICTMLLDYTRDCWEIKCN